MAFLKDSEVSLENNQFPKISRRGFLRRSAQIAGKIALALSLTGAGGAYLLHTPDKQNSRASDKYKLYPGWIESRVQSKFFQKDHGHIPWLKEAVLTNDVLFKLTSELFWYLNDNLTRGKRVPVGKAINFSMARAEEIFSGMDPSQIDPELNLKLEAAHAALIPVAAVSAVHWFKRGELVHLGAIENTASENLSIEQIFWCRGGLARNTYGRYFPVKGKPDPECTVTHNGGQDRQMHVANSLFLAAEYYYSQRFGLAEHLSIPGIIRAQILFKRLLGEFKSDRDEAAFFAKRTGELYEDLSTLKLNNLPILKARETITGGRFDPNVNRDLLSNSSGSYAGVKIIELASNRQSLTHLLRSLNHPLLKDLVPNAS